MHPAVEPFYNAATAPRPGRSPFPTEAFFAALPQERFIRPVYREVFHALMKEWQPDARIRASEDGNDLNMLFLNAAACLAGRRLGEDVNEDDARILAGDHFPLPGLKRQEELRRLIAIDANRFVDKLHGMPLDELVFTLQEAGNQLKAIAPKSIALAARINAFGNLLLAGATEFDGFALDCTAFLERCTRVLNIHKEHWNESAYELIRTAVKKSEEKGANVAQELLDAGYRALNPGEDWLEDELNRVFKGVFGEHTNKFRFAAMTDGQGRRVLGLRPIDGKTDEQLTAMVAAFLLPYVKEDLERDSRHPPLPVSESGQIILYDPTAEHPAHAMDLLRHKIRENKASRRTGNYRWN